MNAGHGRAEIGEAMAEQVKELGFFTNWSYAHPPAIELAARIAGLAPEGMDRVFFTSGGSEAVESAMKMCRAWHRMNGDGQRIKVIAREIAYHGTTMGALSATGITDLRKQFEPLTPGGCHVPNTNSYHWPEDRDPLWPADELEARIEFEGPETVSAVIMEPVQNAGGAFVPPEGYWQRVREICDKHGVLLISDEVICSWGRLGEYFGAQRYDYVPDLITTAKGLTSAYAPMGAVIAHDKVAEPFMKDKGMFVHGLTFGGHPVAAAAALANLDIFEREDLCGHVRAKEDEFKAKLDSLLRHPDRRRRPRGRLLLRDRAGQGQGDQGGLLRRGVRDAAARLPLRRALRAGPDLPRRRPRRPRDPALAAAGGGHRAVRGDRVDPPRRAHRGRGEDGGLEC